MDSLFTICWITCTKRISDVTTNSEQVVRLLQGRFLIQNVATPDTPRSGPKVQLKIPKTVHFISLRKTRITLNICA